MAPAVHTPVEGFTGTVVGVHFQDGVGNTDDPAALGYFQSAGYRIEDAATVAPSAPPVDPAQTPDPHSEASGDSGATPPPPAEPVQGAASEAQSEDSKRPYPQANKGEWFAYLEKLKPGHGLTIENTKNEIIAAVDAK